VGSLGRAYALTGRRREAARLLDDLDERSQHRFVSAYGRALIYLGLGDDRLFEWLERACDERAGWVMYLATDPRFDVVRGAARFRSVLQRLNLPVFTYPDRESSKPA
jgi:hypothetical protein